MTFGEFVGKQKMRSAKQIPIGNKSLQMIRSTCIDVSLQGIISACLKEDLSYERSHQGIGEEKKL